MTGSTRHTGSAAALTSMVVEDFQKICLYGCLMKRGGIVLVDIRGGVLEVGDILVDIDSSNVWWYSLSSMDSLLTYLMVKLY